MIEENEKEKCGHCKKDFDVMELEETFDGVLCGECHDEMMDGDQEGYEYDED